MTTSPEPADPTFEVRFTAAGRRSLNALSPSVLSAVIEFAFGELARQPWRVGKPLRGELAGNFSARRGPYRLLYRIEQDVVFFVRVNHRGDVYRHPLPS